VKTKNPKILHSKIPEKRGFVRKGALAGAKRARKAKGDGEDLYRPVIEISEEVNDEAVATTNGFSTRVFNLERLGLKTVPRRMRLLQLPPLPQKRENAI